MRRNLQWLDDALCTQTDPELFFAEYGDGVRAKKAQAKAVCAQCTVVNDCADYAKREARGWDVWAGVDRRSKAARRNRAA